MNIKSLTLGPLATNCYIITGNSQKEAVVIDPAAEVEKIIEQLKDVRLGAIIFTHAHWDHIGAAKELKNRTGAPIISGKNSDRTLGDENFNLNRLLQISDDSPPRPDKFVGDGDTVRGDGFYFKVLHTPGHSPGGISLLNKKEKIVFCGDLLFAGSVGRCDLPGGSIKVLKESIHKKILTLENDVKVYPGHGPSTRIKKERNDNPFLN